MKGKWLVEGKIMECPACGSQWSPQIKEGGKLFKGSQQCPNCK